MGLVTQTQCTSLSLIKLINVRVRVILTTAVEQAVGQSVSVPTQTSGPKETEANESPAGSVQTSG